MNSNGTVSRVHYYEKQFLSTDDFSDEQAYHLAMHRRHNIAHHRWGIVYGLEPFVDENGNLTLLPGMAIDGYGRELIVPEIQPLPDRVFDENQSEVLHIFLLYNRVGTDKAPAQGNGCSQPGELAFDRWQEEPLIYFEKPDPTFTDSRQPKSVPEADRNFAPQRHPPDDPQQDWPVFLGQVERKPPSGSDPLYTVNLARRPYVRLVGEAIQDPAKRSLIELQPDRFAISGPGGADPPHLQIDAEGGLDLRGKTTLEGDLTMRGGAIEFRAGSARAQTGAKMPHPWRIYRPAYRIPDPTAESTDQKKPDFEQEELRIEMAGGTGGYNQVVIGVWSAEDEAFKPCLTIRDDCSVVVHGNLFVQGQVTEQVARVEAPLTAEANNFRQAAALTGMGGAGILQHQFYQSPFEGELNLMARLLGRTEGRTALANSMQANPTQLNNFAAQLKANFPDLATQLRTLLAPES